MIRLLPGPWAIRGSLSIQRRCGHPVSSKDRNEETSTDGAVGSAEERRRLAGNRMKHAERFEAEMLDIDRSKN